MIFEGTRRIAKPWQPAEIDALRARFPNEKTRDVAQAMGRTYSSVCGMAAKLGLRKSVEFLADPALSGRTDGNRGVSGRIQKGAKPWNKGMKGLQIGGKATQFPKGHPPHNTAPIGSYRIDKDGTLQRKISNAKGSNSKRWRGVHELVWVEANGPVPPRHIVIFKPGMKTAELSEITVDKVECISWAENMRRNARHNLPKEINEVIQLRAVLSRHINKRSKANEQAND